VVPAWAWHEHASSHGEAVLFSFTNRGKRLSSACRLSRASSRSRPKAWSPNRYLALCKWLAHCYRSKTHDVLAGGTGCRGVRHPPHAAFAPPHRRSGVPQHLAVISRAPLSTIAACRVRAPHR
jgi:hypothetical protein